MGGSKDQVGEHAADPTGASWTAGRLRRSPAGDADQPRRMTRTPVSFGLLAGFQPGLAVHGHDSGRYQAAAKPQFNYLVKIHIYLYH